MLSQNSILPDVEVYNLDGSRQSASNFELNEQVIVIFFWNVDDRNSLEQASTLNEEYESTLKGKDVRIVSICTNQSGTMPGIRPLVSGLGIDFEVYIDRNNELKRAMNIPDIPYTMIIKKSDDVYRHMGNYGNLAVLIANMNDNRLAKINDDK